MATIQTINNGDSGLTARTILNEAIQAINYDTVQGVSYAGDTLTVTYKDGTTQEYTIVAGDGGGTQGTQGIQGVQGIQGIQGLLGLQGTTGLQGITGSNGAQGEQGIQGTTGIQGDTGVQGTTGLQGTTGAQGTIGIQGTTGIQGDIGLQGVQGLQGLIGTQGTTGIQGIQGTDGSDNYAIGIACSDETTALTTGTAKATFRMPFAMTLTAVRATLTGAGSTSGTTTVDINENGTSILSTKLTIDNGEKTSTTAATAAVISDSALADDAEITIDIDAVTGGANETGLKVWLIGTRA